MMINFNKIKNWNIGVSAIILLLTINACSPNEDNSYINITSVEIPDVNFESYLIEQGFDSDGVLNGSIAKEDAALITVIDLPHQNGVKVSSLQGIEGFTNLRKLIAYNQNIYEINLGNNHKLDTLNLEANYLTHLDLTNNRNLKFANIAFNQLTSITGLSNLQKLNRLNLSYNLLSEITIQNSALTSLIITDNPLTSIALSDATELSSLLLQSNRLTAIDVSKNLKLTTLILSDNPLETIDLSENSALTHFYSSSTLLNALDVSNNIKLVDLRVHQNPNLTCIKIHSNQHILTTILSDYQKLNKSCN